MALALNDLGYKAIGIRIDSGDLAYLSNAARDIFERIAAKYNIPWFAKLMICASNDINEETILSLNEQVNLRAIEYRRYSLREVFCFYKRHCFNRATRSIALGSEHIW